VVLVLMLMRVMMLVVLVIDIMMVMICLEIDSIMIFMAGGCFDGVIMIGGPRGVMVVIIVMIMM
jgi:hypothetical protein